MMRGFVLRVCLIWRTNDKWIMLRLLIKQHFHVFFKEKKCSNGRVERLIQGLWGLALYYKVKEWRFAIEPCDGIFLIVPIRPSHYLRCSKITSYHLLDACKELVHVFQFSLYVECKNQSTPSGFVTVAFTNSGAKYGRLVIVSMLVLRFANHYHKVTHCFKSWYLYILETVILQNQICCCHGFL